MNKQTLISIGVILVIVIVGLVILQQQSNKPGKYAELAACLGEKGATFYGAFWCPKCGSQKKMFGADAKLLPYVECSQPDGEGQTPICIEKKIGSYPTWEFADGSQIIGVQEVASLAAKTGCPLPSATGETAPIEITPDAGEATEVLNP